MIPDKVRPDPVNPDLVSAESDISDIVRPEPTIPDLIQPDARKRSETYSTTIVTVTETLVKTKTTKTTANRFQPQRLKQIRARPIARNIKKSDPNSFACLTISLSVLFMTFAF